MKSKYIKIILALCCVFGFQLTWAQDATTNTTDSGAASQTQTGSASYDDTMKWIQSKLETWTTSNDRHTSLESFNDSGNIILKQQTSADTVTDIRFNLSDISFVQVGTNYSCVSLCSKGANIHYNYQSDAKNDMSFVPLYCADNEHAERIASAFRHAIELKKAKELF